MADELIIEVTGSAQKADSALTSVIKKLETLKYTFDKLAPSIKQFTQKMESIASSSKAFAQFEDLKQTTKIVDQFGNAISSVSKKTENLVGKSAKQASQSVKSVQQVAESLQNTVSAANNPVKSLNMQIDIQKQKLLNLQEAYKSVATQNGIDSKSSLNLQSQMLKTGDTISRLTERLNKAKSATSEFDVANQDFLKNYKHSGFSDKPSSYFPVPDTTPTVTPAPGSSRLAFAVSESNSKKRTIDINTTPAQTKLQELQAYIDSLTPSVSKMSEKAQADFQNMSTKLTGLGQQIDNQRALWHKLTAAQGQAAAKFGENSNQALKLEKQMLSADSALGRLIDKQEKLKAQMSQLVDGSKQASSGFFRFGKSAEDAGKKSVNGMTKLLRMVKAVTISLITFKALTAVQQGVQTGIQNIAQASSEANYYLSQISTSSLYLKNSLGAALMPVIQTLTPYIVSFTDALAGLFNTIGMLAARVFNGATTFVKAKKSQVDYAASLGKTTKAAKEAQRTIAGFDEINALSKPSSDSAASATPGMPNVKDMFETVEIPEWIEKIGKFTDKIKDSVGDWSWLGKGLGYFAIGLAALKGLKWLGEITGVSKLISQLWKLRGATNGVNTAFSKKNNSLDSQTKKTRIETSALKNLVPWLLGAGAAALGLGAAFDKVRLPALNPSGKSLAPALSPAVAPAIDTEKYFKPSLKEYLTIIAAPAFSIAVAPAILLNSFWESIRDYQTSIVPPVFEQAIAPAIDTEMQFEPSLTFTERLIKSFQDSTLTSFGVWGRSLGSNFSATLSYLPQVSAVSLPLLGTMFKTSLNNILGNSATWGSGVMSNLASVAGYIPVAFASPLTGLSMGFASFFNNTAENSGKWANALASNSAAAMEAFHSNVVNGLKSAWESFKDFMVKTGESALAGLTGLAIYAPKLAGYVQKAIPIAGMVGLTVATGGATAPMLARMIPALATGGLVTDKTLAYIGEGKSHEAVIPLEDGVYSRIGKGIQENGGFGDIGVTSIVSEIRGLRTDIQNLDWNIKLYANNREIAEAANAGNRLLDRARHSIAST